MKWKLRTFQKILFRPGRSYNRAEAIDRDLSEIENLEKGGPIAYADYFIFNNGTISENVPQIPKEEFEEPIPHKEYEPALKKDVGKLRHYVKLVEKHIDHKIIQDITEQEIKVATRPHIVPVLYP